MKNPTLPLLVVAVVLGAVGGGTTAALMLGPGESFSAPTTPAPASADPAIGADIAQLRKDNDRLRERVVDLERHTTGAREPVGGYVTRAEFDGLLEELTAAKKTDSKLARPAELQTQVADVLQGIREQEAVVRAEKKTQARSKQVERHIGATTELLGLEVGQVDSMRTLLGERAASEQEVLRLWQEGADDQVVGQAKRSMHQTYETSFQALLHPSQLQIYLEQRERDRGK